VPDRSLDPGVAQALEDLRSEFRFIDPTRYAGPFIDIVLRAANVVQEVQHYCNAVPDGYQIIQSTAPVFAAPGRIPTSSIYFLQTSGPAPVYVRMRFVLLREDSRNVLLQGA
jgi:hypothetical protein